MISPSSLILITVLLFSSAAFGQLAGPKYIPGDYATISSAVNAVNAAGVGAGGVTFNVAANYTESVSATISLTATGTAANAIVFQKDPATSGANPIITAYTTGVGTPATAVQDGIWRLVGSDYVTLDGIDVRDNPVNTTNPSTMEYGYALYKAGTSNGCQFVTIKNCVITLNSINNALGTAPMVDGSAGIIAMNALPATATTIVTPVAGGTNSSNRFYSNTIQNCNIGIALIGYAAATPFTLADTNNDVGGSSALTGNTIINYGGAAGATNPAAAIRTLAQYGLNVSYNTINSNNGGGTNHPAVLRGIYINTATSANAMITFNTVTLKGGGTTQAVAGIENASGSTAAGNTINISNNLITNCTYTTTTTGGLYGIYNTGTPATLTINSNTVSNSSTSASTTGSFYGIYNSAIVTNLTISTNTLVGNSSTSLAGLYYAVFNAGAVTATININSNNIGNGTTGAFTFNAANSGAQIFINNTGGAGTAALSISNNNFQGITYAVQGTGTNTYVLNSAATLSQAINSNTFTSLSVNTTNNITFISNSVTVSSTGTQNVNSNSIVSSFNKTGVGGTVTLFTSAGTSVAGSVTNNNNNNFSNITVTGATIIAGWVNTDAGAGATSKTIQNNIFSNWTGGTSAVTAMSVSITGTNNATTGNAINTISSGGSITGITTGTGNDNIYSNTINTLVSSGGVATTVSGIVVTGGTVKNIYQNTINNLQANSITTGSVRGILISGGTATNAYQNIIYSLQANSLTTGTISGIWVSAGTTIVIERNKIYDLSSSSAGITTGIVYGVQVSGAIASITRTIRNNLIGDLRTSLASAADPIRGIGIIYTGVTSVINVYYNTVYLNATSSGTNFGSTGIYHTTNAVATTAALDLRNNIISNTSVPSGTGLTVAYRRSSAILTNYAATSNNNLFYGGPAAINKLIYYDVTNSDQTLATYRTRVSARDAQSITEDLVTTSKFLSTSGPSASFLHLDPTKATQAESGAVNIGSVPTDFDGQTRQGNAGYAGTGTAPDIGADEMNGTPTSVLTGIVNVGTGQAFISLTSAGGLFAAINSLGLSGNLVVNIASDLATEDGSNALYQWAEQGSGNYTLTIKPDASVVRTISGNVLAGLIRLNGAKRVIIDGSNGTTNAYLTFRNTNTAGSTGTAFTFINGASNNAIRYCTIEAFANATNGAILFSTSTVSGGNSNNLINNCKINATVASNTGNVCIYSLGTGGKENTTNTISHNNIYNYRDRGLDIAATGSTAWLILDNSFYNGDVSGTINYAAATLLHGIRVLGGAGYVIDRNYIGGNAPLASGTSAVYSSTLGILSYQGILLTTTSATPFSEIESNAIASIAVSAVPTSTTAANVFIGIETNGSGINIGGVVAGDGNMIGSNTINGSISVTTTTTATNRPSLIRGINCLSAGGFITGNQVGGIDIKNVGTGPAASTFLGVYANNATTPSLVNNNIIGSTGTGAVSNSIRVLSSSLSTTTTLTGISIGATVTSNIQVTGNTIKNISHQSTTASGIITGINTSAITPAVVNINNNTISGNATSATAGAFYGIYNNASNPASLTISTNSISGNTSTATSGTLYGIYIGATAPIPAAITINNNTFATNTNTSSTGVFVGIYNASVTPSLSITANTINGNTTTSAAGLFYAIFNAGAVTTNININSNNIGTSSSSAITYNAANSGVQLLINNTFGGAAAALSISNNNFNNINYVVAGTGAAANTYISNSAATLSQTIDGNTFTNLNVNMAGNITFISDNVILPASGTQNVNNNSIAGTFTKKAGGTVTLFTSASASVSGSINNNNNNFSNIIVTGATTIAGWVNTDAGGAAKTVQNNTFSNWSGGTGPVTAMSINSGTSNATAGNVIHTISGGGAITAITTGLGNDNIYSNTIRALSTTGNNPVTAIAVTAGTTKNIYKNKIYDISASNISSTVNGLLVSGGTTVTVYNNLIGDLRTTAAIAVDPVRGISVTSAVVSSTINIYYNTIYLNASSSGTNFGTTGIYHVTSAAATTASLNLRNNSITNTSTPTGTGFTVAYRRSSSTLTNYAATSNNNLFYAGTPGTTKLIFYDGTNSDQTIAAYLTRVAARDAQSVTENLTTKFLSTTGSSPVFLHMDDTQTTLIESGAVNIGSFTDDFDGQIRAGNTGYTGVSLSPDIGADEISGIETVPPTITYILLTNTTLTANRNVTGVTITDASGINTAAGTKPRIYYKRISDANAWLDNSPSTNGWKYAEATNSTSPFTFTIDYSMLYGGATGPAGVIQYFVVAQDIATTANVGINSGTFASTPSTVALTSGAFPIGGTINSYSIPFSGTFKVGITEVFTSLTKAGGLFAAINSAGMTGNATYLITSDLSEDGTNALNEWTEFGVGNYTLTIQPDAATLRTISGNVVGGLILLNGADRVTIDGSNSGSGIYLGFRNTNTAGSAGTAFTFLDGATNNAIRYCNAEAYANATHGVILFSTSTVAGGNSNNLIDHCTVNATVGSNTGDVGIHSEGTAGNENSSNTISNNVIADYRFRGLSISATGSSAWTISGNSLYNGDVTGTIDYAAFTSLHGIRVLGGSGYSILNNYIGGDEILAAGANASYGSTLGNLSYHGILLTTSSASPASFIKGNKIAAISISSAPTVPNSNAFTGIGTNGSGIDIGGTSPGDGNTIGSNTSNGSIDIITSTTTSVNTSLITGIHCASTGGLIIGNQVGGIDFSNVGSAPAPSTFVGLHINTTTAPSLVNQNIIGSAGTDAVSNSIRVLPASTSLTITLHGIVVGASVISPVEMNGNTIQNINNLSTTSSGSFIGIDNSATSSAAVMAIINNTVRNISTAANASVNSTTYTGIFSSSPSTIRNDTIDRIRVEATGTGAHIRGIHVSGAFAFRILDNFLSNFSTASTKTGNLETGTPSAYTIAGILNSASIAGQEISGNTLTSFSSTTAAVTNTAVTGIAVEMAGNAGVVFGNRLSAFTNKATGTSTLPGISGIMAFGGSFNAYNNSIKLDNSSYTNGVKIYGINHAAGNNWYYYYNTVSISGHATGTAARSAAFIRSVNSSLFLRNNIFVNTRTGNGSNYAISNLVSPASSNWPSTASDYNNLYSGNASTIGEWGNGTNQTFSQWKSASGGDQHSVGRPVSFLTSAYDLEPNSLTDCALDNAGTPITTPIVINTDINTISRSAVTPDLGAYEFTYTTFIVTAINNSPVCSASLVSFTSDPGTAVNPTFSWTDPGNVVVSTVQNPDVPSVAGLFTVTVTDENGCIAAGNSLVSVTARPTGIITGAASICFGSSANLNLAVTGAGTVNGTLSNGDPFSGTAPLITVTVSPISTTSYSISTLSDGSCVSIPTDVPDTVTVVVNHGGDWRGIDNNWNNAANWCSGIPTPLTDVTISPGTPFSPQITGSGLVANLTIDPGASFTITGGATLSMAGDFVNNGTFIPGTGTIIFDGTGAQTISGSTTSDFYNITITNTAIPGVSIQSNQNLSGVLTLAGNVIFDADGTNNAIFTLISTNDSTTAAIGILPGGAQVTGNVTVQRYMSIEGGNGGRIYRYISSPIQTAFVHDIQNEIPVTGSFIGSSLCAGCGPLQSMFGYDETIITDFNNNQLADYNDGYIDFPSTINTETLIPGKGYTLFVRGNIPPISTAGSALWDVRGSINRANVSPISLPVTFTSSGVIANDGWNLVGNPFPSTIDWNSASGWTRSNLDGAIHTTDNGGTLIQYAYWTGSIGANGGSRYIAAGQGFWVKANAAGPVLQANENIKASGTQTRFFREFPLTNLLRITMKGGSTRDETVIHFSEDATKGFDSQWDAAKLPNETFNLSSVLDDGQNVAINSMSSFDCGAVIKINVANASIGNYLLNFSEYESFAQSITITLFDKFTSDSVNIRELASYPFAITADPASYGSGRFKIGFVTLPVNPDFVVNAAPACEGIDAIIRIVNSQKDVTYFTQLNGTTISPSVVGNGGEIVLTISYNKLKAGQNLINVKATMAGCTADSVARAIALDVIKKYEVTSVEQGKSCQEGVVTLAALGAPENGYYNWYESELSEVSIISEHASSYTTPSLMKSKTYFVSVANVLGCEGSRKPVLAEVLPFEPAQIIESGDSLISNYPEGNQWFYNHKIIAGATQASIVPRNSGLYHVEVTLNDCILTSADREFVITEVDKTRGASDVTISPNPVIDKTTIEISDSFGDLKEVKIMNDLGQVVGTIDLKQENGRKTAELSMTNYSPGVYIIQIIGTSHQTERRIVKL